MLRARWQPTQESNMWNKYVNKTTFGVLTITLILGWIVGLAWLMHAEPQAETPWVASFFLVFSLAVVGNRLFARDDQQPSALSSLVKKFTSSKPGLAVRTLLGLIVMLGTGGIIGILVCIPIQGIAQTLATFPEMLRMAIVGGALSVIGFAIFFIAVALAGKVVDLSCVYEGWIAFQSPVIGGVVGAAIGCGYIPYGINQALGVPDGMSGVGLGVCIVGIGTLVGGLALVLFETTWKLFEWRDKGSQELKIAPLENSLAGMVFGAINSVILAVLFRILIS
jgi:hypothetical protein